MVKVVGPAGCVKYVTVTTQVNDYKGYYRNGCVCHDKYLDTAMKVRLAFLLQPEKGVFKSNCNRRFSAVRLNLKKLLRGRQVPSNNSWAPLSLVARVLYNLLARKDSSSKQATTDDEEKKDPESLVGGNRLCSIGLT